MWLGRGHQGYSSSDGAGAQLNWQGHIRSKVRIEAELELRGSSIFLWTKSEENGEDEMGIWASGYMVGERWALLVNPELERGHSLYSDGQMQAVAETSWAGLKAQLLYTPAPDVGLLRGRNWARDCRRKISKWTKQVLCLPAAYTIAFLQGNS